MAEEPRRNQDRNFTEDMRKTLGEIKSKSVSLAGAGIQKVKAVSPGSFTFAFIFAVINYALDFFSSFSVNGISITIDLITFGLFIMAGVGVRSAVWLPLIAEVAMSSAFVWTGLVAWATFFLIIPWWVVYGIYIKVSRRLENKFVTFMIFALSVFALFLLFPAINASFQTTDYVIDQKFLYDTWDYITERVSETKNILTNEAKIYFCALRGETRSACRAKVLKTEEQFAETLTIDNSLPTGFTMRIENFIDEGRTLFENRVPTVISAQNNLEEPIDLVFSCGFKDRSEGNPVPARKTLGKGILSSAENTIICDDLNQSTRGTPIFFFKSTAERVTSVGQKDIVIVNIDSKKALLEQHFGIDENRVVFLSKEFGPFIKERLKLLNPRVGENDLIQPIVQAGQIVTVAKSPILYGVEAGTSIDIAVFLKNNARGEIVKIDEITFPNLPSDVRLEPANCGVTKDKFKNIDFKRLKRNKIEPVTSCKLVFSGTYTSNPEIRTLVVKIIYDYKIEDEAKVRVAWQN